METTQNRLYAALPADPKPQGHPATEIFLLPQNHMPLVLFFQQEWQAVTHGVLTTLIVCFKNCV